MKKSFHWHTAWEPWIFLLPTILGLVFFRIGPILVSFFISFTDWDIISPLKFAGLANYREMLTSPAFYRIFSNTLIFSLIYVSGVIVCGLFLATLLNQKLKGIHFFRSAFYTPVVTSAVAIGITWTWILSPKYGVLTILIEKLGFDAPFWLGDPKFALLTVALIQVWKMSGYYMIIFLAGLQNIPATLKEAATIDGAGRWKCFQNITLPLLTPTTFFVLIISTIDSFKNFELIYAMTRGGPQNATTTLVYDVYINGFVYYRMGYSSSIAYVLLAVVLLITALNFYGKKRWVQYQY